CRTHRGQFFRSESQSRFFLLVDPHAFPSEFQQQSTRLQAWNQTFFFRSVGKQAPNTPEPLLQTEFSAATGLNDPGRLLIAQESGDAIHAGLPICELSKISEGRTLGLGGVPVG